MTKNFLRLIPVDAKPSFRLPQREYVHLVGHFDKARILVDGEVVALNNKKRHVFDSGGRSFVLWNNPGQDDIAAHVNMKPVFDTATGFVTSSHQMLHDRNVESLEIINGTVIVIDEEVANKTKGLPLWIPFKQIEARELPYRK